MKRSMLQVFVRDSGNALAFYQKAFDADVLCSYPDSEGRLMHSELDVYGQILAISELTAENMMGEVPETGNTMMFCLELGEGQEAAVHRIYDVLKDGAAFASPLEKCDYSPLQAHIVDKYGVRWCFFI
jgi:PhnB protein